MTAEWNTLAFISYTIRPLLCVVKMIKFTVKFPWIPYFCLLVRHTWWQHFQALFETKILESEGGVCVCACACLCVWGKDRFRTNCFWPWGAVSCLSKTTPGNRVTVQQPALADKDRWVEADRVFCDTSNYIKKTQLKENVFMFTPVVMQPEEVQCRVGMHVVGADSCCCPLVTSPVIDPVYFPPVYPRRYGKIVSTKAILDKTTNKCKGKL